MPGKQPERETKIAPGPGNYAPVPFDHKPVGGPKYSMGTGPKEVIDKSGVGKNPGPGNYI